ncbi:ribonuclease H-like domain-containing protein [Mycena vulgaris]|nr:ribonuclease H-like domain-containing protein [Mycena vulgaris]
MATNALWAYFHRGEKQNTSQWLTYCKGCVANQQQILRDNGTYDDMDFRAKGQSFRDACAAAGSVRGDKAAWIPHILGSGRGKIPCPHASAQAKAEATSQRDVRVIAKQKVSIAAASDPPSGSAKHGRSESSSGSHATEEAPSKRMRQSTIQAFNGHDMPFTTAQIQAIQAQTLRATISTGVAFRFWENREVKKLFRMMRTAAPSVLPSRKVIANRLLNEAAEEIEDRVRERLCGEIIGLSSDGWKSLRKASVNAVCASLGHKVRSLYLLLRKAKSRQTYVLELFDATAFNKDGPALCAQFEEIIERIQTKYKCFVIFFVTDADGGSKKGRILLGKKRPYLFVPSCWAHQFQLILGDYFKVYAYGREIAESATGLIAWINNHGKVRKIFDQVQAQLSQERTNKIIILAYLVANLTRWTTHFVAFMRLLVLREYLQFAVMQSRGAIIAAQVGAAKSTEKQRLEEEAIAYCDLIGSHSFWSGLTSVVEDLEPICYGTNINQTDSTRADQVLLTLAGLYLHFIDHPETAVSSSLVQRIENRWADCDQPLYLVALILNPFEGLACFGPKANFDHFKATSLVVNLYRRVMDHPENKDAAEGKDPVAVWKALEGSAPAAELAKFAGLVFAIVVNQAACERVFSEVKNNESPHRARTALETLEKMSKINGGIREDHLREGPAPTRGKRKNHDSVEKLLAVPRYRDLLEDQDAEDESDRGRPLVSSSAKWRIEMAKWIASVREADLMDAENSEVDSDADDEDAHPKIPAKKSKWVKTSLAVLFGGPDAKAKLTTRIPAKEFMAEARLMHALAQVEAEADAQEDARLDDGAMEIPSEDEYQP